MANVDPRVKRLIVLKARKYGVDPAAALAVAMGEGGIRWGAVGDNGTSFGPFQLHVGGALPKGKDARWANSPAGVDYAIRKIAESGARGLRGEAAVNAIVRNFERPADPDTSVANAIGRLGQTAPLRGGAAAPPGAVPASRQLPVPQQAFGTLNDIFRKAGLEPLDIVGDLPLSAKEPSSVLGRAVPPTAAAPAQPRRGKLPRVQRMVGLIEYARQLGLNVTENPYVDETIGKHTKGSHHYQAIGTHNGRKVGRAIDVSGDPDAMMAFFRYAAKVKGVDDLFHDPAGWSLDRGRRWNKTIGGHGNHVHVSVI